MIKRDTDWHYSKKHVIFFFRNVINCNDTSNKSLSCQKFQFFVQEAVYEIIYIHIYMHIIHSFDE